MGLGLQLWMLRVRNNDVSVPPPWYLGVGDGRISPHLAAGSRARAELPLYKEIILSGGISGSLKAAICPVPSVVTGP